MDGKVGWRGVIVFCILLLIALLPACSQNNENSDASEITADATAKIYRACAYPNGDFCDSQYDIVGTHPTHEGD